MCKTWFRSQINIDTISVKRIYRYISYVLFMKICIHWQLISVHIHFVVVVMLQLFFYLGNVCHFYCFKGISKITLLKRNTANRANEVSYPYNLWIIIKPWWASFGFLLFKSYFNLFLWYKSMLLKLFLKMCYILIVIISLDLPGIVVLIE